MFNILLFQAIRSDGKQHHYSFPICKNTVEGFLVQVDRSTHKKSQIGRIVVVQHRESGATCKFEYARVDENDNAVRIARLNYTPM